MDDKCLFCIYRWQCKDDCRRLNNDCDKINCQYNTNGQCLDKQTMMKPDKQTGCLVYSNMNIREGEHHERE